MFQKIFITLVILAFLTGCGCEKEKEVPPGFDFKGPTTGPDFDRLTPTYGPNDTSDAGDPI